MRQTEKSFGEINTTGCESSLERNDPESVTKTGVKGGGRRGAGIVGLARSEALRSPKGGASRAKRRARPTMNKQPNRKAKKGTFLSSFDKQVYNRLTLLLFAASLLPILWGNT
jgi:hypothetical protein